MSLHSNSFKHLTYLLKPVLQETPAQAAAQRPKAKKKRHFYGRNRTRAVMHRNSVIGLDLKDLAEVSSLRNDEHLETS